MKFNFFKKMLPCKSLETVLYPAIKSSLSKQKQKYSK